MAVEAILIQGDDGVDLIALVERLFGRDSQPQPGMPAANYGLVAVVGVDRQALPTHRQGQGVAGRGDTVSRGPTDSDNDFRLVHRHLLPFG